MEEMLCSLASPCFLMWINKGGQYKSCGNVITFPQDLSPLCTTLPWLPEDLDIILIHKPDDNLLVSKDLANVMEAYVNMLASPFLYRIGCNEYCSLVVSTEWNRS